MLTRTKIGTLQPPNYAILNSFNLFIFSLTKTPNTEPNVHMEPTTITKALSNLEWKATMKDEYDALMANNTWSLVFLFAHMYLVGCKRVFRIKYNPNGTIQRYKARLVAKAFNKLLEWTILRHLAQ